MGILVNTQNTQFSEQEFINSLVQNWLDTFGELPKKESIGIIYAQWALETGQGKSCYNFNIGNVKYNDNKNDNTKYMMLKNVWEIIKGAKIIYQPPHPATFFRAFDTLDEGVFFHLQKIKTRFKNSWVAVEEGNPEKFAHLLKISLYYTAPEADYVRNMRFYFDKYMKNNWFQKAVENSEVRQTGRTIIDNFDKIF